jgi:IS1 family transposase
MNFKPNIGRKTDKIWLWTAINHHAPGILAMEIGDRQYCSVKVVN